jgi:spore coat polysaccharide biosynthesis protein SpsF
MDSRRAVLAVIQARTSSQRLPDKVLLEVAGKPLLAYILERLAHARSVKQVVLATSTQQEDDRLAELCMRSGTSVHRGSLDDVLGRIISAVRAECASAAIRISGDSPLIDPRIVDQVVDRFHAADCDIATNVFPRSYPKGQSVEVITIEALERAAAATQDPADREHVTRFFYRHGDAFVIANVECDRDLSAIQLSVDSASDFDVMRRIVSAMTRPHWEYGMDEVLALRERVLANDAKLAC